MEQHYFVAGGPFGGRFDQEGDEHLLRVMSEEEDGHGFGVRMTARSTWAGPFSTEQRAREVLSSIIMSCPEFRTDEADLPTWKMNPNEIAATRNNMGLDKTPPAPPTPTPEPDPSLVLTDRPEEWSE